MADRGRRVRPQVSDDPSDISEGSSPEPEESEGEEEEYDPRALDAMRRSGRQE